MLGVGSGSSKSSKIRRIIKNGLQAWYKADETQAPLGEEEIANGKFNTGPELFSDASKWVFDGGRASYNTSTDVLTLDNSSGGGGARQSVTTSIGDTFLCTFTINSISGYAGGEGVFFRVANTEGTTRTTAGTYSEYITVDSVTIDDRIDIRGNDDGTATISNISVKKTNPNDSWHKTGDTVIKDGTALVANNGILFQPSTMVDGKKYRLELDVSSLSLGGSYVRVQDNDGNVHYQITSNGHHVVDFTHSISPNEDFQIAAGGSASAILSNITLKEITNSVKDFSPNVNNGVLYSGKALNFDGTADYIDIDYWKSKTIDDNTKATFAVWFNDDNVSSGDFIFGTNTSASDWFYLGVHSGNLELGWHDSGWTSDSNSIAVVDNTWYRAVVVIDGYVCRVYLNGELAFSKITDGSFTLHATGLSIGAQGDAVGDFWDGMLADFQIYDKAWTASDVAYDYNNPDKDVFDDEGRAEVVSDVELVTNGTFDDTDNWFGSVSISGGQFTKTNGGLAYQGGVVTSGKTYKVTVDVETVGAASQIYAGGKNSSNLVAGVQTVYITAGPMNTFLGFNNGDASTVYNSISVKEVTTQAGEISPIDCTALYRLNEGAGNRLYNAAPVLRENITKDYDFTSGWGNNGDVVINDADTFTTSVVDRGIYKTYTETGKIYKLTVVGTTTSSTGVKITDGSHGTTYYENLSSGSFSDTVIFTVVSPSNTEIFIRNKSTGETTITTLKVEEVHIPESYVQTSWVSGNWITAQPYIPQHAMSSYSKKMIFDGSDDYVALGSEKTIAADEAFSFSFWYYNINTSSDQAILGNNGSTDFITLDLGDEGLNFVANNNSNPGKRTFEFDSGSELVAGKLNHIVLTKATGGSGTMKCYLNGIAQTDTEAAPNEPFDYQHIFRSDTNYGEGFIDELAHFNKELSATEVQEIFNAGIALDCRDHSAYLGSEIVTNGGFDDAEGWDNRESEWTISGGKASVDSSGTKYIRQVLTGLKNGKIYNISFEISDYVQGSFQFGYNQFHKVGTSQSIENITKNGVYNYTVTAEDVDDTNLLMYAVDASKFSLDNLSVKEVQLNGYWRNNGIDTWTDLSPYGNNGTVNGSPTTIQLQEVPYFKKDTFGLPMNKVREKGLNLDGSSYVTVDDSADFDFGTTGFTIQAWVKPFSLTTNDRIITKGTTDAAEWMVSIGSDNASVRVFAEDSGNANLDSANTFSTLSLNTWAMITAVIDTPNDQILFYKDDGNVESKTGASWSGNFNGTAPLRIGANEALAADRFDGVIDDVKVYNRVLSQSEIIKNYKATRSNHLSTSNWSDDFDNSFI